MNNGYDKKFLAEQMDYGIELGYRQYEELFLRATREVSMDEFCRELYTVLWKHRDGWTSTSHIIHELYRQSQICGQTLANRWGFRSFEELLRKLPELDEVLTIEREFPYRDDPQYCLYRYRAYYSDLPQYKRIRSKVRSVYEYEIIYNKFCEEIKEQHKMKKKEDLDGELISFEVDNNHHLVEQSTSTSTAGDHGDDESNKQKCSSSSIADSELLKKEAEKKNGEQQITGTNSAAGSCDDQQKLATLLAEQVHLVKSK